MDERNRQDAMEEKERRCGGKRIYRSWREAHRDVVCMRRKRMKYVQVYGCRKCGLFHVGGDRKKSRKAGKMKEVR